MGRYHSSIPILRHQNYVRQAYSILDICVASLAKTADYIQNAVQKNKWMNWLRCPENMNDVVSRYCESKLRKFEIDTVRVVPRYFDFDTI